jgi:hypothetical protein
MKATVLAESAYFSFIFKPTDTLQQSADFSQVGAAPFPPIYQFIYFLSFQVFVMKGR